jgi:hypothetical protein
MFIYTNIKDGSGGGEPPPPPANYHAGPTKYEIKL